MKYYAETQYVNQMKELFLAEVGGSGGCARTASTHPPCQPPTTEVHWRTPGLCKPRLKPLTHLEETALTFSFGDFEREISVLLIIKILHPCYRKF